MGPNPKLTYRFFDEAMIELNLTEIPMANYVAACRTNYFKVGRPLEFKEWVDSLPDVVWQGIEYEATHDMIGMLYVDNPDGSGWPTCRYIEEEADDVYGDEIEFDIFEEIAEFLAPDEVVIFMEVGAEKLRYLHGQSIAVHSSGEIINITLNDIYRHAKERWPDSTPSECSY